MDQIWAPWRMAYIAESEPQPGCLFCRIAQEHDDEKNLVVYRGPRSFAILNRYPYNPGHLMVAPFQHTGSLTELPEEVGADIFAVAQLCLRALEQVLGPEGYNLGINQGKVAGAGIADHIHLHIVPRWNGDTNFMPVLADVKVIPESLSATASKLRPAFPPSRPQT